MNKLVSTIGMVLFGLYSSLIFASPDDREADRPIDQQTMEQVIDALNQKLTQIYIFPEKVETFVEQMNRQKKEGALKTISSSKAFSKMLNEALVSTINDGHLRVYYSERTLPEQTAPSDEKAQMNAEEKAMMRSMNYGVNKIERFPFNVGYIDLSMFADAPLARDTIAATFGVVANTDALIIDLRFCRGGDPQTVALIASYLLDEPTHLSDIYTRQGDKTERIESLASVDGKHYGESRPLYILTSQDTFSAAEDFAYTLKHLKRGVVVGEVTGGGAHPGDFYRLSDHFEVFIPNSRSINPITQTNWEGVGVQPTIQQEADNALDTAQAAILKQLHSGEKDAARAKRMQARIKALSKNQ